LHSARINLVVIVVVAGWLLPFMCASDAIEKKEERQAELELN